MGKTSVAKRSSGQGTRAFARRAVSISAGVFRDCSAFLIQFPVSDQIGPRSAAIAVLSPAVLLEPVCMSLRVASNHLHFSRLVPRIGITKLPGFQDDVNRGVVP